MAFESDHIIEPPEPVSPDDVRNRRKPDVNMLELCVTLARRKTTVLKITAGLMILTVLLCLVLPARYTAQTVILPPPQTQSFANVMLGQLSMLANLGVKDLGLKNSVDLYSAVLASQSVLDGIVDKFGLMSLYHRKTLEDTRKMLERRTTIKAMAKEGLIEISVTDSDAKRAAAMANAYIDQLQILNQRLALTESSQRRLFLEKQLQQTKENLIAAEQNLKQTQEKTGVLQLDSQSRSIIATVTNLKAQIAGKEVQIQAMKSFATSQNPDLVLAEEELAGLHKQLSDVLREHHTSEGDIEIPTAKVPAAGLAYIRAYRDLKYNETIYEIIAKQYEAAKLDEAKSATLVQVVDPAMVPERRSFPPRLSYAIVGSFLLGMVLGCAFVIVQEAYRRFAANAENRAQLELLRSFLLRFS